jgi:hypothetical protein
VGIPKSAAMAATNSDATNMTILTLAKLVQSQSIYDAFGELRMIYGVAICLGLCVYLQPSTDYCGRRSDCQNCEVRHVRCSGAGFFLLSAFGTLAVLIDRP